jgi:hypothetical protein
LDAASINWRARAEKAEQRCAELAAAVQAIKSRMYPPTKVGALTQDVHVQASEVEVLFSCDPLLAYRAQVERETLERVMRCKPADHDAAWSCPIECWESFIKAEFAPKGETDART